MFGGWFVRQLNWFVIYAVATRACGPSQHQGLNTEEWGIQAPGKSCNLSLPQATQHRGAAGHKTSPSPGWESLLSPAHPRITLCPWPALCLSAVCSRDCSVPTDSVPLTGLRDRNWVKGQHFRKDPLLWARAAALTGGLVSDLLLLTIWLFFPIFSTLSIAKTLLETSNLLELHSKQFWVSPVCND